jgi:hypothetical protein
MVSSPGVGSGLFFVSYKNALRFFVRILLEIQAFGVIPVSFPVK